MARARLPTSSTGSCSNLAARRRCWTATTSATGCRHRPDRLAKEHSQEFAERFGLGFGEIDREENIRRIGSVAALMASAGLITLTAFVSPYRRDRDRVRKIVDEAGGEGDFIEVFVDTPLESLRDSVTPKVCTRRPGRARSRTSPGSATPTRPPKPRKFTSAAATIGRQPSRRPRCSMR